MLPPMLRSSDISQSRRLSPGSAVAGLVLVAAGLVGCGEDVLVARFGLTSNGPDAGLVEAASTVSDASAPNAQQRNAQKARANARALENAASHGNVPPKPSDSDADKKH